MTAASVGGPRQRVDLHTHSAYSDGALSPAALVAEAHLVGIGSLGLTDHDTLAGLPEARAAAAALQIEVIPGVELSADEAGVEVHVLGYFVPEDSPVLADALASFARDRVQRVQQIVANLVSLGVKRLREKDPSGGPTLAER